MIKCICLSCNSKSVFTFAILLPQISTSIIGILMEAEKLKVTEAERIYIE